MKIRTTFLAIGASLLLASSAVAVPVNYVDTLLGNGSFSWTQGGVTLSLTAASGGVLGSIPGGVFAGAWLGKNVSSSGLYTLSLSHSVTFFEFEFDALSSIGVGNPEVISGITTNPGGAILSYLNQGGTTFAAGVITSTANDGQGTVTLTSGTAFNSVTFLHTQNPSQNGFVIERVTLDGVRQTQVPDTTPSIALLGLGLVAMLGLRRKV